MAPGVRAPVGAIVALRLLIALPLTLSLNVLELLLGSPWLGPGYCYGHWSYLAWEWVRRVPPLP
jgi:hypothetical protein